MRFLVDMALSPELAQWLCGEGHDAMHAKALSMGRSSDLEILQFANVDERVVVTADLDFRGSWQARFRGTGSHPIARWELQ